MSNIAIKRIEFLQANSNVCAKYRFVQQQNWDPILIVNRFTMIKWYRYRIYM